MSDTRPHYVTYQAGLSRCVSSCGGDGHPPVLTITAVVVAFLVRGEED